MDRTYGIVDQLTKENRQLKAEIERLKAERDEARTVARAYHKRLWNKSPGLPLGCYDTYCAKMVKANPWLEEASDG